MATYGAYSPSLDKDFSSFVKRALDPGYLGDYRSGSTSEEKDKLYLAYIPNDDFMTTPTGTRDPVLNDKNFKDDGRDIYFDIEDRLYFLSPGSNEKYFFQGNFGQHTLWPWGRGGILITILNEGSFTKASNFRKGVNTKPSAKINGTSVTGADRFGTKGMDPNEGFFFTPYYASSTSYDGAPQSNNESIEFFKQKRNVWDTCAIGMYTAGDDDDCFFGLTDITCQTIIKIELLCSTGSGYRMKNGFQIGNSDWIQTWSLPQIIDNDILSTPHNQVNENTESNGAGNHGFILFHPKTGQFIFNNTIGPTVGYDPTLDVDINSIPEDLIFFGPWAENSAIICPDPRGSGGTKDILVYKDGGDSNTQGEIQPVIFYDKESN